ncbi:MAG: hypothetical protein H3C33_07705 [Rhodocyclaceae bacterium]|nr:hypothetical protein [Rhodocyclaceae bacterium]
MRSFRFLLALLLGFASVAHGFAGATATTTRVAVLYSDADGPAESNFAAMIEGMARTPGIEVIRMELAVRFDADQPMLVLAERQSGSAPLMLAAADGPIAVLYPDIGEPYRSVFTTIIEGIENEARSKVVRFAIGTSFDPQQLSDELKRQDVRVVIALGRNGLRAANALDRGIGVVAGGIVSAPEDEVSRATVLSLAPDPALLFARLKEVSPQSRRVFVVYEPDQNEWLIRLARTAAQALGIELVTREARDIKAAAEHYRRFFAEADPRRDALWLPQDSITANESTILPLVLQESWTKGVAVFSSSAPHVQRGVLFALYPNNTELGRKLAASALKTAAGARAPETVLPLRDVLAAFNTRTARRLGLDAAERGFDLIFPQ